MLNQFKKAGIMIAVFVMTAGFCGCAEAGPASSNTDTMETESEVATTAADTGSEPEGSESNAEDDPNEGLGDYIPDDEAGAGYAGLYLDEIEKLVSEGMADQFALVNIDEDDTPELVASDSAGSYDHDNAFIYTVSDDNLVLLAEALTGVDGTFLCFSEGKNLIRQSGSAAGASEEFFVISDGKLKEVFRAEMIDTLETDADDEEIYRYSVNGEEADLRSYTEAVAQFVKDYDPLVSIEYDGMKKITYKQEDDTGWFEQTETIAYSTKAEVTKQLKNDSE